MDWGSVFCTPPYRSFSRDVTANYAGAGRPEVSHAGGQASGRLISK